MANEEQLSILKQGVETWNKWREENPTAGIQLISADLTRANLMGANLIRANLWGANLRKANLKRAVLTEANLRATNLTEANLCGADFQATHLYSVYLDHSQLDLANFSSANIADVSFALVDFKEVRGLEYVNHLGPSTMGTNTLALSQGKIPGAFLRGCGLSDWEIEAAKLYNPGLSNDERNKILYRIYDLQASQGIQISPLFISYSHGDNVFVDKIGNSLTQQGIRYWRDIKDLKAGRVEKQLDEAIRQNPTVLLVLSEHSLASDWVEHEVRTARELEKEMKHDVLCPVALDDSWKDSRWPKRVMEQIMEYNILDFSAWEDDSKFASMFRKLIDGLELFYKG